MKKLLGVSLVLAAANVAVAGSLSLSSFVYDQKTPTTDPGHQGNGDLRDGISFPVSYAGLDSVDPQGSALNTVLVVDVAAGIGLPSGTPVTVTGIGWDTTQEAFSPSWLSEMVSSFYADNVTINLTPGVGDDFSGVSSYSSGGIVKLSDVGIPDMELASGSISIELWESFDDFANATDGRYIDGGITLQAVPEPATIGLLCLGGLALIRRR